MAAVEALSQATITVKKAREGQLLCPTIIPRNHLLPFDMDITEQSANGAFSRCFKHEAGWAIKIHEYAENGVSSMENVQRIINIDKQEYEQLKKGGLGSYATDTTFIIGRGPGGNVAEIQAQPWIDGRVVGEMDRSEVWSNEALLVEIKRFGISLLVDSVRMGRFVDYMGLNFKRDCSIRAKLRARSLLSSNNLMWDGEKLHLVDVTNHTWRKSKKLGQIKHNLIILFCVAKDLTIIDRRLKQLT